MNNICLLIKYKGTRYCGWQSQRNGVSIQDTVEEALFKIIGEKLRLYGCGRTDAGVHAAVYAANFKTEKEICISKLAYSLNAVLPDDVAVFNAFSVNENFNARYSCLKKRYTYTIFNSRLKNPFISDISYRYHRQIDIESMKKAAAYFIGTHDFSAFRSLGTPVKSTVRTIYDCKVTAKCDIIETDISANGFLYNMARTICGTLVYVSEGRILPERIPQILSCGERRLAGPTAPAQGLCLTGIEYNGFSAYSKISEEGFNNEQVIFF